MASLIHPTALVSPKAKIGQDVKIGAFSIIGDDVILEEGTEIQSHCVIGIPTPLAKTQTLHIGAKSLIRSHSNFYNGSDFSKGIMTGHGVSVRENTVAGARIQFGSSSEILGDTIFGDYVRLHSGVFVAKYATIGNYAWLCPHVMITDDPHPPSMTSLGVTIGEYAVLGSRSVIGPGLTVGRDSFVAMGSIVNRDVREETWVAGVPAKERGPANAIKLREHPDLAAYPWRNHFHRGYPEDVVSEWKNAYNKAS